VRIVDSRTFPPPRHRRGGWLRLSGCHARNALASHPNDEWQLLHRGGQAAHDLVFASEGKARTFDYQAGDVGYVPFARCGAHSISKNTGDTVLRFLEMFQEPPLSRCLADQLMA